ncbi:hypothetical protein HNQ93_002059 [Hymenobacter luteus]|uniref:Outer membrane protein beta-barrel domain-containing protein n=2 Tax=Hymenobacter TaxID=89966 RepID=A0A7W9WBP6_9BACT|nr:MULTISPECIES: hypothetical protein [Hymenobacter]MBB4600580.1 hypothetical protein [Hymenobacter latericoloratus]MBB6059213.1 hypothetical protein [Hymenobacter luteus]
MNRFFSCRFLLSLVAGASLLVAGSCTAPRAIVSTGKVTPKGEFRVGGNVSFNAPTQTLGKLGSTIKSAAEDLANQASKDSVYYSQTVDNLQVAALAYILDPVRPSSDLYLRYGLAERFDVGYKYAFGSHVFDAMYQFMGPTGTPENPGSRQAGATYGSIGLQYATQRAKLPNIPFLDNVNSLLGFKATRHDVLVPLVFSTSLGPEEEIGAISYGVVYAHSFVRYGLTPGNLYNGPGSGAVASRVPELPTARRNFSSFGAFFNAKLGYRYAYFIPALSVYYQNYGEYQLLNNKTASLKGFTFIPSLGLQFRIPTARR